MDEKLLVTIASTMKQLHDLRASSPFRSRLSWDAVEPILCQSPFLTFAQPTGYRPVTAIKSDRLTWKKNQWFKFDGSPSQNPEVVDDVRADLAQISDCSRRWRDSNGRTHRSKHGLCGS